MENNTREVHSSVAVPYRALTCGRASGKIASAILAGDIPADQIGEAVLEYFKDDEVGITFEDYEWIVKRIRDSVQE